MKYLDINGTLWYSQQHNELFLVLRDMANKNQITWNRIYSESSRINFGITNDKQWTEDVKKYGYKYVGTLLDLDLESFIESLKNEI